MKVFIQTWVMNWLSMSASRFVSPSLLFYNIIYYSCRKNTCVSVCECLGIITCLFISLFLALQKEYLEREMEKRFIRTNPLGKDRYYNRYWFFRRDARIFVESSDSAQWGYYSTKEEVYACIAAAATTTYINIYTSYLTWTIKQVV